MVSKVLLKCLPWSYINNMPQQPPPHNYVAINNVKYVGPFVAGTQNVDNPNAPEDDILNQGKICSRYIVELIVGRNSIENVSHIGLFLNKRFEDNGAAEIHELLTQKFNTTDTIKVINNLHQNSAFINQALYLENLGLFNWEYTSTIGIGDQVSNELQMQIAHTSRYNT